MRWGLAIGGGGRNGAFAAGALYRLVSDYGLRFHAVSGTSTGALMAGPALLDQVEILNDLYRGGVTNRRVLARRWLPMAFLRGSLAGTGPLRELVEAYSDPEGLRRAWLDEGRIACVSTVNLRTGRLVRAWSRPNHGLERWTDHVVASASLPVLMDGTVIDGDVYADGGLVDAIPVAPLLDLDIDGIVVLANSPEEPRVLEVNPAGIRGVVERTIDVMVSEIARRDLPHACESAGKRVEIIRPEESPGDCLEFDPAVMERLWLAGFDRAAEVLEGKKGRKEAGR